MLKRQLRKYAPILILLGIGIWVLDFAFGQAIWNPNNYLLGRGLDALKNYFTPSWYIHFDTGTHFSGMNYPFGEHVSFTDNQPLFSWLINLIDDHLFPLADYSVGILNGFVLWGLLLSMVLLYAIGRHYGLPQWYAIPVAIILSLLTPQMHRFAGHYALAYGAFIPLVWWMLIRTSEGRNPWRAFVGLCLVTTLGGFVHPYYLLMGMLFSTAYLFLFAWSQRKTGKRARAHWVRAALALLVPLIFFQGFMAITDSVTDRPPVPSGFFFYKAQLQSIFLPVQGPLWEAWHRFFYQWKRPPVEAFAYVGFTATFVGILTLVRSLNYGLRQRWRRMIQPALPGHFRFAFWAAILVGLFSLAIPFRWGMEFLLDILTPLRQFRSLGRFAWVFYYVFTMYAALYLYWIFRRLRQKGLRAIGLGILIVGLGVWAFEMAIHVHLHSKVVVQSRGDNVFANEQPAFEAWLSEAGYQVADFQASLPIPSFFIGSDKFVPQKPTEATTSRIYKLAFDTGLPMIGGSMSRTSLSHSIQSIQIMSGPYVEKEILAHFPSEKPILILREFDVPLTYNEQWLLELSELLIRKGRFALYKLPLSSLQSRKEGLFEQFTQLKDSLRRTPQGLYTNSPSGLVAFEGYDGPTLSVFGEEEKTLEEGETEITLFEGTIPDSLQYHASAWMKIKDEEAGLPFLVFQEWDSTGAQVAYKEIGTMFGQYVYRNYLLVEHSFRAQSPGNRISFRLANKSPEAESFLLRPEKAKVWLETLPPHRLMYNNFYLESN